MDFDVNILWGMIFGAFIVCGIWFWKAHKKLPLKGIKKSSVSTLKTLKEKVPKRLEQADDTPPDSDWPGSTFKEGEVVAKKPWWAAIFKKNDSQDKDVKVDSDSRFAALESEIARLKGAENKTVVENVSLDEKARQAALEEMNPLG